jgi:hypothetical protein
MRKITRRQFVIGSASLMTATGWGGFKWLNKKFPPVTGNIIGASSAIGHKLREGKFPLPSESMRKKVVIIGGGIAGLSAAWKLHKSGFDDFILLEMEKEVGGNSSYGGNSVSAYPWGAHYVPLLAEESTAARELFSDLGIITGYQDGQPVYNEYYLSAAPHERLFMYGRWQEGIVPQIGISDRDKENYQSFFAAMENFKTLIGNDGRKVFAIPLDKSSADPVYRQLDNISMVDYLHENGWDSPYLQWYVNYCCRDDYGANAEDVSAWAGIHYFAGRSGKAANADPGSVITWPEGNGWIVKQLKSGLADYIQANALAFNIAKQRSGVKVQYLNIADNKVIEIEAENAIFATPRFIAERLHKTPIDMDSFHYSPWMVANVTLDALPQGKGAALAWDNMAYDSKLLGYVVATHQNLNRIQRETVLTYYWPLTHLQPKEARKEMIGRSYEQWRDIVLNELLHIHPELKGHVKHLDVWLWGHGMIRPTPGFIWGKARREAMRHEAPLFYAHSDMSGISIFEEANHHGVQAAEALMEHIHHPYRTSL